MAKKDEMERTGEDVYAEHIRWPGCAHVHTRVVQGTNMDTVALMFLWLQSVLRAALLSRSFIFNFAVGLSLFRLFSMSVHTI